MLTDNKLNKMSLFYNTIWKKHLGQTNLVSGLHKHFIGPTDTESWSELFSTYGYHGYQAYVYWK